MLTTRLGRPALLADAGGGYAILLVAAGTGAECALLESPSGTAWRLRHPSHPESGRADQQDDAQVNLQTAAVAICNAEEEWGLDVRGDPELIAVHLRRQLDSLQACLAQVLRLVRVGDGADGDGRIPLLTTSR